MNVSNCSMIVDNNNNLSDIGGQSVLESSDTSNGSEMEVNDENVDPNEVSDGIKKRKRYSLDFQNKVVCVKISNNKSINKCAEFFNIDRRLVSSWIKKKDKIGKTTLKRSKFRVKSDKDLSKYPVMEAQLFKWIKETRQTGGCISGFAIKQKAIEFFKNIYEKTNECLFEFKASSGWFSNFCNRKDLVLRRITTKGRELPKNSSSVIRKFFEDCQNVMIKPNVTNDSIINMDETSIYLDFPTNYTYDSKGCKRVPAHTTGSERTRLSAAFTATASGKKLPILILVPRKTELQNFIVPNNVILIYKTGATFNDDIICEYLDKIIKNYSINLTDIHLYIDSARCHLTKKVENKCSELNIQTVLIPPRMTNLLQPADVCWFSSIKAEYHKLWNNWYINETKTFTRHDNARSPGYVKCIEWLSKIWLNFDQNLIVRSFQYCGIVNQYDLHAALKQVVSTNTIINDFIDDLQPSDDIDGFSGEENDEVLFESDVPDDVSSGQVVPPTTSFFDMQPHSSLESSQPAPVTTIYSQSPPDSAFNIQPVIDTSLENQSPPISTFNSQPLTTYNTQPPASNLYIQPPPASTYYTQPPSVSSSTSQSVSTFDSQLTPQINSGFNLYPQHHFFPPLPHQQYQQPQYFSSESSYHQNSFHSSHHSNSNQQQLQAQPMIKDKKKKGRPLGSKNKPKSK